jgi:hypothetical protein
MNFNYCISNPAFNVAEGSNVAGTGGNTTLYKTATRNDFDNRLKENGTLINITLKGIIPDLVNGYFKDYQVNWIHLMDNIDVWPYNTCIFSVSKTARVTSPVILGGMAAKIYRPDSTDCFPFVYYSGSNNGMNERFGAGKKYKVIRQLPGKNRDNVAYDYTDTKISAGPKLAFYTMESRKSYTVTSEPVYGGTICYIPFDTKEQANKMKLFVEKNPVFAEYVKRMKLRGHAFGLRNIKRFDIDQIVTGLETPQEWNITTDDLIKPIKLENDITEDRDKVKALGEVFTPTSLVNFTLDLLKSTDATVFTDMSNTFMDSMCGDGQFLVAIKNKGIALENIYGIEVDLNNVKECKRRLNSETDTNIVQADSLGETLSNKKVKIKKVSKKNK